MRRTTRWHVVGVLLVFTIGAITLAACSPTPPSREPDISGTITSVTINGETGLLRIEEAPGQTGDNKAVVSVTSDTRLFRAVDGASPEPITIDDINEGMQADAWFTGPVAESYPLQATGEAVLVSE